MRNKLAVISIDLGASSGKTELYSFDGEMIRPQKRFHMENRPCPFKATYISKYFHYINRYWIKLLH